MMALVVEAISININIIIIILFQLVVVFVWRRDDRTKEQSKVPNLISFSFFKTLLYNNIPYMIMFLQVSANYRLVMAEVYIITRHTKKTV